MADHELKTILLVEDDPVTALAESIAVREFGYNVVTAGTGEIAVSLVKEGGGIDLILMDINLGDGIDGPQAARQIIEMRDIPIVFLTSHSEKEYVDRVKQITRYGYVIKNSGDFVLRSSIEMAFELFDAHRKTKEKELLYLLTLDSIADTSILLFDHDKRFIITGGDEIRKSGFDSSKIVGKTLNEAYPPDVAELFGPLYEKALRGEKSSFEMEYKGMAYYQQVIPVRGLDGKICNGMVIAHNITERKRALEALRESEELISLTLHSIGDALIATDVDGLVTRMNATAERLTGWSFAEAENRPLQEIFKIVNSESRLAVDDPVKKVLESGKIEGLANHTVLISRGGNEFHISDSAAPIIDKNGSVKGVILVFSDITEKYRAVENMIREKNFSDKLINSSLDTIFLFDPASHRAVRWNERFLKISGYSDEEIKNMKAPDDFFDEEDLKKAAGCIAKVYSDGFGIVELSLITKQGRRIPFEYAACPLETPDGGILFLSIGRDVTARRMSEDLLRESNESLRVVLENNPIAIWDWDIKNDRWFATQKYYTMLGYKPESGYPDRKVWLSRVHPDDRESVRRKIESVLDHTNEKYSYDARMLHADGSYRWQTVIGNVVERDENGRATHMIGVRIDISERKFAEEKIKTLLEEKELLLKEVHHRIKNNMNTIAGIMHIQSAALKDPAAARVVNEARNRVISMMSLYDKLCFSENYDEISFKEYFMPLLDEILSNYTHREMIKTELNIENFTIDSKRMFRLVIIVNELITNIMKHAFTGRTGGLIKISVIKEDKNVTIAVQDDGIGIPEDVGNMDSGSFGLKLVEMMAQSFQGDIKIERDNGTKFILKFSL